MTQCPHPAEQCHGDLHRVANARDRLQDENDALKAEIKSLKAKHAKR